MIAESKRARQLRAVRNFMISGSCWWYLSSISRATGAPEASASARLRDLRRLGFLVEKERQEEGRYLYRVTAKPAKGRGK